MKLMAHPQRVHFSTLYNICFRRGLKVQLHIFDGGETVSIKNADGKELKRITREYGQTETASTAAFTWLLENDYVSSGDLEG
jgi:hypothetical protein